ncbi:MAG: thioredoxin family protein [Prevotella sp.]|nr:thioredoxin family protein [Prevotella sp.]
MKRVLFTVLAVVAVVLSVHAQGVIFVEDKSLSDVLAQAKNEGKLVFVDCYTEWCGPCKMMATKEFVKKEAGDYFNAKFVNFKIDMEKGEGPEVGKKYDVNAYPTFLILESNGDLRGRLLGAAGIDDFIKKVEAALKEEKGLPWYQKKFRSGERDPQFLSEYIKILGDNYMRDEVKNVSKTLLAGKTGAEIAADATLYNAFTTGEFLPNDDLFLNVYKERAIVLANQGEKAVKSLDSKWTRLGMHYMKFDGKEYKGFDSEGFEAYKQKMIEYGVPDVDAVEKEVLHSNAVYGKDCPTLYKYFLETIKEDPSKISDNDVIQDLGILRNGYKENKKAMKTVKKYIERRTAYLKSLPVPENERTFEYEGKRITLNGYFIEKYQEILNSINKK